LLNEIGAWVDGAMRLSDGQTHADLHTLHEAILRVALRMKTPDRPFPPTLRFEAMDVLRRQGEDEFGLDPVALCRAARMLVIAAPTGARQVENKAVVDRMAALRQENQTLQSANSALSQRCAALEEMIALMQEPATGECKL